MNEDLPNDGQQPENEANPAAEPVAQGQPEGNEMNDIDSIVLDEDASQQVSNQPPADVRLGWDEVSAASLYTGSSWAAQVPLVYATGEDDESTAMSSQYEARRAEARARTENMNVDETVELDNTEADEENKEQLEAQPSLDALPSDPAAQNLLVQEVLNLTFVSQSICQTIKGNTEPTQQITELAQHLRDKQPQIIATLLKALPEEQVTEFVKALKDMTQAMLDEQVIMDPAYVVAIFQLFHTLIVDYYGPLIDRLDMCQLIDQLLHDRNNLYQAIAPVAPRRSGRNGSALKPAQNSGDEKKKEEIRGMLDFEAEKKAYARIESEAEWRNSLAEGDYLDAVTTYKTPASPQYNFITGWAQAKVLAVDENQVTVGYLGRSKDSNRKLNKQNIELAPFKKFADWTHWKEEMKEGDLLDACDEYGVWYKSMLIRRYSDGVLDCDDNPVEMFHIACRYPDPNGLKVKDKVKYTGWLRDEFDLRLEKNSPSVRPFSGYTNQYFNVAPEDMKYDLEVRDQEDTLFQTEHFQQYANQRKDHYGGMKYVATIIDDFGLNNGFNHILNLFESIRQGHLKTSVEHIGHIIVFLARTLPLWTREFMCTQQAKFVEAILGAVGTNEASNPLKAVHTRGHINILLNNYHQFLRRYYVPAKHINMHNYANSLVGCILLKLENLEKRIFGIKLIGDQIGNLPYLQDSLKRKEDIVDDLMSLNAFEIIFSSKNFHLEILKRAEDVLRLYAQTQSLTPDMVNILWETRAMDETACLSVYSIIGECVIGMNKSIVNCFVDKIKEINPMSMLLRDVELLHTIGRSGSHTSQARYCADALWDIVIQQKTGYSRQVLRMARKKLCELLRVFDTAAKVEFINQCVFHVSDPDVLSLQVLQIMFMTINWLPKHTQWMAQQNAQQVTLKTFVSEMVSDAQLIDILINDLESYKEMALKEWRPDNVTDTNVFSPRTIETYQLMAEGYTHAKNLDVRLTGLLFILESTIIQGPRLTDEQLQRLWDILMGGTKLPGDQKAFFRFFRRVLQERDWLSSTLVNQFFEEKIEQNNQIIEEISLDGFTCIQTMFLYINESQNFITIIKQPVEEKKQEYNTYNSNKGSAASSRRLKNQRGAEWQVVNTYKENRNNASTVKGKLEFRVHEHPNRLRGIEMLWLLFQKGPSRDLDLLTQVVHFLAQVYHSISRVLADQRKAIYTDFVNESLQRLREALEGSSQGMDSQKKDLVKNTMGMLVHSLSDTEVAGSASIRPHFNVDLPSQIIHDITVQSYLSPRDGQPKYFSFSVDSSMTVWEFIDFIAKKLNLSPRKIKVQRISSNTQAANLKKPEFTAYTHCTTLQEMKVENGEEFTVMRNLNNNEKVPLINPQNNELVPDARIIFEEWFDTFARPKEEFEDAESLTEEKYMDKEACVRFMTSTIPRRQAHQAPTEITENSVAIKNLYLEYDTDEDGKLTKDDFLRFYSKKSLESPTVVWSNLEKHNIGRDLMLGHASDLDLTYDNDQSLVRNQEELPRYFISANQDQFSTLFDLELFLANSGRKYQEETMESVWRLIGRLKTSPQLYLSLLRNENLRERLSDPDQVSSYRLLYSLQILYSLMANYRTKASSSVALYLENRRAQIWNGSAVGNADYDRNFPGFEESKTNDNANPLDQVMEEEDQKGENISNLIGKEGQTNKWYNGNTRRRDNNLSSGTGEPIALQDAGAVDRDRVMNNNPQYDRFGNLMSHSKRQIHNWKGQVANEQLEISMVSDEELCSMITKELTQREAMAIEEGKEPDLEIVGILASVEDWLSELKQRWLVDFIARGGFTHLLTIMKTIIGRYSNSSASEILNNKAEVSTLRLTAYLVKVTLISCFCSRTEDSNLAGNLQRRMSTITDKPKSQKSVDEKDDKMSDLIAKQQDTANEFQQLQQLFSENTETSDTLLESVNLSELQDLLQSTLRIILQKQSLINAQDRQVVVECLDIWTSLITFKNELLLDIYGNDVSQSTEIVTLLIEQGLFSETASLRQQFKDAIEFMSFNIKTGDLPQAPAIFFLQKLIQRVSYSKQLNFTRTPDFFELLIKLMNHYFKMQSRDDLDFEEIFEPSKLIKDLIRQLDEYKSQESKTSIIADHTLVGILRLAQTLFQSNADILTQDECSGIMTMLIKQCLFNQTQQPYSGHIMNAVDLSTHQSSQINKCHTDESRNAAYQLLDTLINSNSDLGLIQTLVEGFWSQFILQLDPQKEKGVAAENSGRSPYGFGGLKNLSSICYMNSVIQQLFNVPSFRYSLLAANDGKESDWQEDARGKQVDNNSLHQWLKLFSFLQMTDRQDYNPVEFCFAFKDFDGNPTNVRVQQDAQEFLNLAFDRLETLVKDTPQKYVCQSAFQGQQTSLTVCKSCGNMVCTDQDFYTLSCTVKNQKTLQQSLENMIAGELIEEYNCSNCKKKVTIEKKQCILNMPNTLIVHLNRIVFDFDSMRNMKLNDKLEFPNELNVRQFMLHQVLADMKKQEEAKGAQEMNVDREENQDQEAEELAARGEAQAAVNVQEDEEEKESRRQEQLRLVELIKEGQKKDNEEFDYKLVGVVIHMGVADAGHYISYANIERDGDPSENRAQWGQTEKQTWLDFNDSHVSAFDFSNMQYKAFGEEDNNANYTDYENIDIKSFSQSHNAYMLVYEKAEKRPLKVVCSEEDLKLISAQPPSIIQKLDDLTKRGSKTALSCDGTAIPRDQQNQEEETKGDGEQLVHQDSEDQTMIETSAKSSVTRPSAQAASDAEMIELSPEEDKEMDEFMANIPHSYLIYPGLVKSLYETRDSVLKYDEVKKEHFVEVPFHNVQKFVPQECYKLVHNDNQLFLAEKQVFCTPFFKTSAQLIEQYMNSVDTEAPLLDAETTQRKRLQMFYVLDKLIFDMLVSGTEAQQQNLPQMTQLLFRVIEQCPEALQTLIKNRVLVGIDDQNEQQQQEGDNTQQIDTSANAKKSESTLEDKVFLDMLVTGRTAEARQLAGEVLSKIMLILFRQLDSEEEMVDKRQIEELIERISKALIDLIPREVQKFWHKLDAFFNFFYTLVKDLDIRRVYYFVSQGLVQKLVDLTGRYNSQVEFSVPPFDKLVATVCTLARCSPQAIYLFGIPDEYQPTEDEIRAEIAQSPASPHWIYYAPENPSIAQNMAPVLLTADIKSLVLTDKRCKDFFNIALKNTQESRSVASLVGHLCWGNYEISRRFGKLILKGLNNTNEMEVKPYVECMAAYLSLTDQYQEVRVEWLMGIASWCMIRAQQGYQHVNKVGMTTIANIEDAVVEYQSTLFKTRTEFEESVLHMMYKYRKDRFVRAMLALLEGITYVTAHGDRNHVLLKYLLTIDPPAYSCRRYWDWIEPHVLDHIQTCSDNMHMASSSDELEICMRIYSNIEHIKNNFGELLELNDDNVAQPTEQAPGGRPIPDAYLMWDIVSDRKIAAFPPESEQQKVVVSVHECNISVQKSRPTGKANESVQRKWLDARPRFVPKRTRVRRGKESGYGKSSRQKKQKDRKQRHINVADLADGDSNDGDDSQDDGVVNDENYQETNVPLDGNVKDQDKDDKEDKDDGDDRMIGATAQRSAGNAAAANADQEMPVDDMDQQYFDHKDHSQPTDIDKHGDDEPQPSAMDDANSQNMGGNADVDPLNNVAVGSTTVNMFEDHGEGVNMDDQPQQEAPVNEPEGGADQNMAEGVGNAQSAADEEEKGDQEAGGPGNNIQNPYVIDDDSDEKEEIVEDPKTEQYTLLVFMVNNQTSQDCRVQIVWNPESRSRVNIRQPVTEFQQVFLAQKNNLPLKFAKVKLGQEWGNIYDFRVIINGVDAESDTKWDKYRHDFAAMREAKKKIWMEAMDNEPVQEDIPEPEPAAGADVDPEDAGKVHCPVCTFLNSPSNVSCEICGSPM